MDSEIGREWDGKVKMNVGHLSQRASLFVCGNGIVNRLVFNWKEFCKAIYLVIMSYRR